MPVIFEASPYGVTIDRANTSSSSYAWHLNDADYIRIVTITSTKHPELAQSWMKIRGARL